MFFTGTYRATLSNSYLRYYLYTCHLLGLSLKAELLASVKAVRLLLLWCVLRRLMVYSRAYQKQRHVSTKPEAYWCLRKVKTHAAPCPSNMTPGSHVIYNESVLLTCRSYVTLSNLDVVQREVINLCCILSFCNWSAHKIFPGFTVAHHKWNDRTWL